MNVYLMFPDQDLVIRPSDESRPHENELVQDLELKKLFDAMSQKDDFIFNVVQRTILSSLKGINTIHYRQEILKDCLKNPDVIRKIYRIPIQASINKRTNWLGIFTSTPMGTLNSARGLLSMFINLLRELRQIADDHAEQFESTGFRRFFKMIQTELDDEYFSVISRHIENLSFSGGVLISASLGRGNEGTGYVLRKTNNNDSKWFERMISRKTHGYTYILHPRDDHGARALGELRNKGINLVANAVAQSADHINKFFDSLQLELAFYVGCLNLSEQLDQLGEPIGFPHPSPTSTRQLAFKELYDLALALTMQNKVVGNDLAANDKDLVIITGANQGGKTTFLRSIGLAQLMMQCGMFVPAIDFSSNMHDNLFTHFKREEDTDMESGKLDEELGRMSTIVNSLTPNSMVLFNESFAATNEREGSEIADQITRALLDNSIKIIYVTHLYKFAQIFIENNVYKTIFLQAERTADGKRTFKIIEGSPLQTSFGIDVFNQIFGKSENIINRSFTSLKE